MSVREGEARPRISILLSQAVTERDCAARAGAAAARHEVLAAAASEPGRGVHAAAAAAHRDAEAFHHSVAEMAQSMATRLDRWLSDPDERAERPRLVAVAAAMLGTPSAACGLGGVGRGAARVSASDATARAAWDAEAVTGHGPATQAWTTGGPCAASGQELGSRWPLLAGAAAALGIHSVVAAPLGGRVGVVCACYNEPIINETATLALAAEVAAALTRVLVTSTQALNPDLLVEPGSQGAVHQATGMIAVQVGCSLGEARDLLAARAYADGVPLSRIACDVIHRAIRFEPIRH